MIYINISSHEQGLVANKKIKELMAVDFAVSRSK